MPLSLKEVVAGAIAEAGIQPEPLAVAGLTAAEARNVISQAVMVAEARAESLRTTQNEIASAHAALDALRREPGTRQEADAARQRLAAARAARQLQLEAVSTPSLALLNSDQARRFHNCHQNASTGLPARFGAAEWTDEQAAELAQACRIVQNAEADSDRDAPPEARSVVDAAGMNQDVVAASVDFNGRLAAIQDAWRAAIEAIEE
ncbi:MAG: hypothetical protein AAGB48_08555 [Planctomycetota bacterium]